MDEYRFAGSEPEVEHLRVAFAEYKRRAKERIEKLEATIANLNRAMTIIAVEAIGAGSPVSAATLITMLEARKGERVPK